MQTVSLSDVQADLDKILRVFEDVMAGEVYVLTSQTGEEIAHITPANPSSTPLSRHQQAVTNLLNFERIPLHGLTVQDLIDESRGWTHDDR